MSRLDIITDWETRAEVVGFRVSELAQGCGVTDRQLRRYFLVKFGSSPRKWLIGLSVQRAQSLLARSGFLVKEVAAFAGFNYPGNFSRRFKRIYKSAPRICRCRN